ncbi:hypothetical protein ABEB36_013703 [Hypothenemus hampei]|uniref:Uncharacterized protein n=1 Tax=Hypothenemus hampei TaxID=57062 RepID=A0ABD1E5D7_HYPHA
MSKFIVYILDKTVWLLLATVITGQALQLAGIMQTPKSAGAIEFQQNSLDNSQIYPENSLRWKRDTSTEYTTERSQFIDMLFNVSTEFLTQIDHMLRGKWHHNWQPIKPPQGYFC